MPEVQIRPYAMELRSLRDPELTGAIFGDGNSSLGLATEGLVAMMNGWLAL